LNRNLTGLIDLRIIHLRTNGPEKHKILVPAVPLKKTRTRPTLVKTSSDFFIPMDGWMDGWMDVVSAYCGCWMNEQ
jgi:hypothetical protein